MTKNVSEEDIRSILEKIKHPAIDRNLLDLGIIRKFEIEADKVIITMALPFPNVPIIDQLINSVKEPIEKLGLEVEVVQTVMSEEELQNFLRLEQENWKGM